MTGHGREHHRFLLTELLTMIAAVDEVLAHCAAQSAATCAGASEALELLNTSPGIGPDRAEVILVEIGTDRRRLPTATHRAARASVTPENNESARKRWAGTTRKGDPWRRVALVQGANGAAERQLSGCARSLDRGGGTRAILAVADTIIVIIDHVLRRREAYQERRRDYFERHKPAAQIRQLLGS